MLRGYRVVSVVCLAGLMAALLGSTASAKPMVYVLTDGKVMRFDAAPALEKSKSWIKEQAALDKEEAKEADGDDEDNDEVDALWDNMDVVGDKKRKAAVLTNKPVAVVSAKKKRKKKA